MAAVASTLSPERTDRQCPRCGRAALEAIDPDAHWACTWCGHEFAVADGDPWPDVVLCLWLPARPTGHSPEPTAPTGDRP